MITEFLVVFLTTCAIGYLYSQRKPKNYPPGPKWAWPLLGHFPTIGQEGHKTIFNMSKKYGPIISLQFGQIPVVVLNDMKMIKEALNTVEFSGRPKDLMEILEDRNQGKVGGIIFNENKEWQDQRRFALRHLRDFGFGKKSMEALIQEEVTDFVDVLRKKVDSPFSTHLLFNGPVLNALWTIMTGSKFKHDDPEFILNVKRLLSSLPEANSLASLSIFIRPIRKLLGGFSGYDAMTKDSQELLKFLQKSVIDPHLETHQVDEPRDFIDKYIDEIKSTTDSQSSFYKGKGEKSMLYVLMDLFAAGAETTSTTLSWLFLLMCVNENIQEEMAKEINNIVGKTRLPALTDRPNMPYTEAVLTEVMRFSTLVPFSVFHQTSKKLEFHGYTIPKETLIIPNLYAAHHDPKYWDNPEDFNPERFLSKDKKTFVKHEAFVAFSTGKRVCLGENLARDQLFLFAAGIFQAFRIKPDPSKPSPSLVPNTSTVLTPKPHYLIISERN